MTLRTEPTRALDRLKSVLLPHQNYIVVHKLTISFGTWRYEPDDNYWYTGIEEWLPKNSELLAPMAILLPVGRLKQSQITMNEYSTDPFGYKPLLETAYGLKTNDESH